MQSSCAPDASDLQLIHMLNLTDANVLHVYLQGPDVYFQCVEAAQPFYDAVPDAVVAAMADVTAITGRDYKPYDYVGHPQVRRVLHGVLGLMGRSDGEVRCWKVRHQLAAVNQVT